MNERPEPRLAQKIINYKKALAALEQSVATPIAEPRDMSGIVKDFEIVYELSWKTLKALLEQEGHTTMSAKSVFAQGYQLGYLQNSDVWLEMIEDRNEAVHTYDEDLAQALCERIRVRYVPAFQQLLKTLSK